MLGQAPWASHAGNICFLCSRSSAVSSPKGEQELMKEVQNLKQQLIDKDKEWAESKTRSALLLSLSWLPASFGGRPRCKMR